MEEEKEVEDSNNDTDTDIDNQEVIVRRHMFAKLRYLKLHATNLLLLQSSHMKQHKKGIPVAGGGDLDIWSRILLINIVFVV